MRYIAFYYAEASAPATVSGWADCIKMMLMCAQHSSKSIAGTLIQTHLHAATMRRHFIVTTFGD